MIDLIVGVVGCTIIVFALSWLFAGMIGSNFDDI